jgi:hypothetical protein
MRRGGVKELEKKTTNDKAMVEASKWAQDSSRARQELDKHTNNQDECLLFGLLLLLSFTLSTEQLKGR